MKVLGLGNALVDILIQTKDDQLLDTLQLPKGSMQLIGSGQIPSIMQHIADIPIFKVSGGSAANTIHGLASLGTPCGYIGKVGNDELGSFYEKDLAKVGVSCNLLSSKTDTGRAYTFVSKDAERTFATYLGAAVELVSEELDENIFGGYDLMHVEGYLVQNTLLIEGAMKLAKAKGLLVSLDMASFNVVEANLEFLKRVIPEYVDILFANEEEAKSYTGKAPEAALQEIAKEVKVAVVKVGKDGSMIKSGADEVKVDIIPVSALDTTGAGDQYAAGFLHAYGLKKSLVQCGKLGALMAGTVIEGIGARIPDDRLDFVKLETAKILE